MKIIVLNSGSNGNAVYVESSESGAAVLLDCGISRRQIELRLKVHGRFPNAIRGVFISHEHGDHVRGLVTLTRVYKTPIYITEPTLRNLWRKEQLKGFRFMRHATPVTIADITVEAFPKSHDAADPVYFLVSIGGKRFLYMTDLGVPDQRFAELIPTADALLLESNYDSHMLWNGEYPEYLKARIDAVHGHLSNAQAMEILDAHATPALRTLILGHISENNNTPELVKASVLDLLERRSDLTPRVLIASRFDVSDVIEV